MNWTLSNHCLAFLLLLSSFSLAQSKKLPKNVKQAVAYLELECPDSLKALIKQTEPNELKKLVYPTGKSFKVLFDWLYGDDESPKLINYIESRGINNYQKELILTAFRNHILSNHITEKEVFISYKQQERKLEAENAIRYSTDSLNGVYIPKDLEECFLQINSFWPDSTRNNVRQWAEDIFGARAHLGFGMWVRNNWGLWGGSRLSAYFNNLGIDHPDEMSGVILTSYHRKLNNKSIDLQQQLEAIRESHKNADSIALKQKKERYESYKLGDTLLFRYKHGFVSEKQEDLYDDDDCIAKGIVTAKNEKDFLIKVKVIKSCDPKGIIYYDNENLMIFNQKTKVMEKPKKRLILRIKLGKEYWSSYLDWDNL
ncbi:DUF6794 domain-containing protein [Pedobacter frigoris]|uniref:DUF6794 domain-containing protein n=1 Tax=Pedobacter frigoris TaxID=2571272 RepID=A0A4U1CS03_9SPHI|nr:DUF6794 domain-containing protein [Pedobacter frigoris]TKC09685.1 hypothetical protein FA047_06290 [Pedobacter frigoris]